MPYSRALKTERPYLRVVRRDEIVAAVEQLDARILPAPGPDPYASPVLAGTIRKEPSQIFPGKTLYRYYGLGGEDIMMLVPSRIDCEGTDNDVQDFVTCLRARLEGGA